MKIPYGETGVNLHYWSEENNGLLAWIEGWANAIQMILDAAHWQEDNEYGLDEGHIYENLRKYDAITSKPESGILLDVFLLKWIGESWTDVYKINIPDGTNSNLLLYARPNTSLALTDNYWIGIDPDEPIYMYLNPNANSGNLSYGNFYTCGGSQILVRNGGLELGMLNTAYTADLTINENSLLRIDKKGKLIEDYIIPLLYSYTLKNVKR